LPLLGDFRTLVVSTQDWALDKARELAQSKALAYQDLLSAPRTRPPTQPTPSRRGPAVVDQSALHVWGARLQKIILRKRPRDLTFVHCTTNYTGSQSG
jgi:hypothetical protein